MEAGGGVRGRKKHEGGQSNGTIVAESTQQTKTREDPVGGLGVVDVLRILGGLFLLNCCLSYFITNDSVLWGWRPWFVRPNVVARWLVRIPLYHSPSTSIVN